MVPFLTKTGHPGPITEHEEIAYRFVRNKLRQNHYLFLLAIPFSFSRRSVPMKKGKNSSNTEKSVFVMGGKRHYG
jgi:hypothetical protein